MKGWGGAPNPCPFGGRPQVKGGPATLVHLQVVKGWGGGGLNPCPFASREGLGGGLNPCPFASREGLRGPRRAAIRLRRGWISGEDHRSGTRTLLAVKSKAAPWHRRMYMRAASRIKEEPREEGSGPVDEDWSPLWSRCYGLMEALRLAGF